MKTDLKYKAHLNSIQFFILAVVCPVNISQKDVLYPRLELIETKLHHFNSVTNIYWSLGRRMELMPGKGLFHLPELFGLQPLGSQFRYFVDPFLPGFRPFGEYEPLQDTFSDRLA